MTDFKELMKQKMDASRKGRGVVVGYGPDYGRYVTMGDGKKWVGMTVPHTSKVGEGSIRKNENGTNDMDTGANEVGANTNDETANPINGTEFSIMDNISEAASTDLDSFQDSATPRSMRQMITEKNGTRFFKSLPDHPIVYGADGKRGLAPILTEKEADELTGEERYNLNDGEHDGHLSPKGSYDAAHGRYDAKKSLSQMIAEKNTTGFVKSSEEVKEPTVEEVADDLYSETLKEQPKVEDIKSVKNPFVPDH